jgi:hypothetical protein
MKKKSARVQKRRARERREKTTTDVGDGATTTTGRHPFPAPGSPHINNFFFTHNNNDNNKYYGDDNNDNNNKNKKVQITPMDLPLECILAASHKGEAAAQWFSFCQFCDVIARVAIIERNI